MKTLRNYLVTAFLSTFLMTVAVFTFVLSIGGLFKLTDLVTKGVPPGPIFSVFFSGMPQALSFAIPVSAITATLLVFGRLSADSEITAMRACGISLWQITRWMLPPALLLLLLCVYINSELMPQSHYARRTAVARLGVINPIELIEEGRTIRDFDGISLYVERKRGDMLVNVRIFDQREAGRTREIKAERGYIATPTNSNDLVLSLEQVTVDPFSFDHPGKADAARWSLRIDDARRSAYYRRRDKDKSLMELLMGARALRLEMKGASLGAAPSGEWVKPAPGTRKTGDGTEEMCARAMRMMVEFHKRLALASSAFAFVVLGIPLGIRSHRKESSLGVALGLVVVYAFYLFIMMAEQLASRPDLRPDLLSWAPVALALLLGLSLLHRLN